MNKPIKDEAPTAVKEEPFFSVSPYPMNIINSLGALGTISLGSSLNHHFHGVPEPPSGIPFSGRTFDSTDVGIKMAPTIAKATGLIGAFSLYEDSMALYNGKTTGDKVIAGVHIAADAVTLTGAVMAHIPRTKAASTGLSVLGMMARGIPL